jgi:hypothetical protein
MDFQACKLGEAIREAAYPSENGYGFYSNFTPRDGWSDVPVGSPLHTRAISALGLSYRVHNAQISYGFFPYNDAYFEAFEVTVISDGSRLLAGYWDGDGILVAADLASDTWVENTDCKCNYYWRSINAPPAQPVLADVSARADAGDAKAAAARAQEATLVKLARAYHDGMPDPDAPCHTCLDGAIAIIPSCPGCNRDPHEAP